jgi:hypothetical protein
MDDFLDLLEVFEGLLDPGETNPAQFTDIDVDQPGASVGWSLDLDGDQTPDVVGGLQFTNEQGDPETAADVNQLAGGFDDLDTMIASLPDGTRLTIDAVSPQPPPFDVAVTVTILGGAVDSVSGMANLQDPECMASLDLAGASLQDVGGDYPSMTLNVSFVTGVGTVAGTIVFDGTNQARAEVTLDGGTEVSAFLINLDTGAVTPAP